MSKLRAVLGFGGILTESDIDLMVQNFQFQTLKPGESFHTIGNVANRLGFVEKGALRVFGYGSEGLEVVKYFVRPNQFAVDLESYYSLKPSETGIEAVLDTEIYSVKRSVWDQLNEQVPKLFLLSKSLTEANLLNKIKDNDFLNFGTASEKYREFVRRYPDLALSVPQQFIASYLKITPQSLSRIRSQMSK
tara:strand:- start:112 stop:684 length:573 start_codon:yes stop_codon:yes gene_type:complete